MSEVIVVWSVASLLWLGWLTVREFRGRTHPIVTTMEAAQDAELERYHDHVAVLTSALDDAVFDACKQFGVLACDGRDGPHGGRCSIGTVHTRTAQVAQLIADMVRDMGAGAEQAAKMVQLLGDALSEAARPVVASMGAIIPAHLYGVKVVDDDVDREQVAVDRYLTVIDHEFSFSPTQEEQARAMELLNIKHTGKATMQLDVRPTAEHLASHYACAASRRFMLAMGVLPNGEWEVASPHAVVALERNRAEARARVGLLAPREPSGNPGELTVTLTGHLLADIQPGLYELEFTDGTCGLAAVGRDPHDRPWWITCSVREQSWMVWNWSEVRGATLVRAATT